MDFDSIKKWFTSWTAQQAAKSRRKGLLGLALVLPAVFISGALLYWILRLFTGDRGHLGEPSKCFWLAVVGVPLTFIANRFVGRKDLMEERMREGVDDSLVGHRLNTGIVWGHLILWVLFTGPRLWDWSRASFREATRWKQTNLHSCAAVLWILVSRGRKSSFEEIHSELDWLDLTTVLPELMRIPGVLMLKGPPPGLTLVPELRDTIKSALRGA